MKKKSKIPLIIAKLIASLGGVGFIKPASATWGSLFATIVLFYIFPPLDFFIKLILIIIVFALGTIIADYIEKKENTHDAHFIVIDEFVGMMITTIMLSQIWWHFALGFVLFRVFDIAKLWPASIFDKKKGGFAAMFDDVLMSFLSLATLHIIIYVIQTLN